MNAAPTADDAMRIARDVIREPIVSAARFATGSSSWVYDIATQSSRAVVVRMSRAKEVVAGAVFWSRTLRPLGVPLPELLASHVPVSDGEIGWLVLERLPGRDLGAVYPILTRPQKLAILDEVLRAQAIVHRLPRGKRFGFTVWPDCAPHACWRDVILASLARSRDRIIAAGAVDVRNVDRVAAHLPAFEDYFASIEPVPFLDDTTTKNVIVNERGEFSGIVDVDQICYGDALFTAALTRIALLSRNFDTNYTDAWLDCLDATAAQCRAVDFYTALFCVDFLGELGQQFNRATAPAVDLAEAHRLNSILDQLLDRLI